MFSRKTFLIAFCVVSLSGCDSSIFESAEIKAAKKKISEPLLDPSSVQFRNVKATKENLDKISWGIDSEAIDEASRQARSMANQAPRPEFYAPGVSSMMSNAIRRSYENQVESAASMATINVIVSLRRQAEEMNSAIRAGKYKNHTGVCLEFNAKNQYGAYTGFKGALCLIDNTNKSVDCLDQLPAFKADISAVCADNKESADAIKKDSTTASSGSLNRDTKPLTREEMMLVGAEIYKANCAACHQANGEGIPGAFPAISGSKIATGPIDAHINLVLNGKPGSAMAAFGGLLSEADIAAVVTYQRNSFGNKVGDMAFPEQIGTLKK